MQHLCSRFNVTRDFVQDVAARVLTMHQRLLRGADLASLSAAATRCRRELSVVILIPTLVLLMQAPLPTI